ncbi:MAG: thiolase family protein [Candidatus Omnitrophica bacterium]|nr:thiolase family protein [Candidatus Omnitrophota bacterium]
MPGVVLIDGIRTPFLKFNTEFKEMRAVDLAALVIRELVEQLELDPAAVDHVIMGNGAQPADAPNVARYAALKARLPVGVPAYTVQRNCAGGMQSITEAAMLIQLGHAEIALAGGTESMSNIPLMYPKSFQNKMTALSRAKTPLDKLQVVTSFRPQDFKPVVGLIMGLTDCYCGMGMGQTAEILAKKYKISREAQDEFALGSHFKTAAAWDAGRLAGEVMTVYPPGRKPVVVSQDNGYRSNQNMEALSRLRPVFDRKFGTVTAGNASQITDGASVLAVMAEKKAKALGYAPKVFIKSWAYAGNEPTEMGLGPYFATAKALDRAGLKLKDMGLIELNEAFATQVLANEVVFSSKQFAQEHLGRQEPLGEINRDILNVNGGAIALGHPIGTSGNRIVLTLMREMERRDVQFGLATLCVGGGQGGAIILERAR